MILAALLSALHILALPLGLCALFVRGRKLRALSQTPSDEAARAALFVADNFWGLAAAVWIATGLLRAFGGLEKASTFYLHNGFFYTKLGLFGAVFALEIYPMVTFIRWRIAQRKGPLHVAAQLLMPLVRINDAEMVLTILIPFTAALMARGLWLF